MTRSLVGALALVALLSGALDGQVPDSLRVDSVQPLPAVPSQRAGRDTTPELPITPRTAFIGSMLLPGWGQSKFGSYFRAGIYFAGWAGNWFMNVRSAHRAEESRARFEIREAQIEAGVLADILGMPDLDSLRAQMEEFPFLVDDAVRQDPLADDLRKQLRAREQQREDWIAWSLFWLLASGVDAYVTAHLSDFPAAVEIRPGSDQGISVGLEVPLPRRED